MAKLQWELRNKAENQSRNSRYQSYSERRQLVLERFVCQHDLVCFKCGRARHFYWAKTGISSRGAWAICVSCVS